jgi:uncharacterized protein YukE
MSDKIKMDYGLMEEMRQAFIQATQQMDDTLHEAETIGGILEDGALLGTGGDAFVEAIRTGLSRSVGKLRDKFDELAQDIQRAVEEMRQAEEESAGRF